jgi:hypothetical protein
MAASQYPARARILAANDIADDGLFVGFRFMAVATE